MHGSAKPELWRRSAMGAEAFIEQTDAPALWVQWKTVCGSFLPSVDHSSACRDYELQPHSLTRD
jgi:hypothetical protein